MAWSQVAGAGPNRIIRLYQHFGSLKLAWEASFSGLCEVDGLGELTSAAFQTARSQIDPIALFEQHTQKNPHFWTPADADYPRLLLEIPDPPPILYYRGEVDRQENQGLRSAIALVGTRSPTSYGKRWTERLTEVLVKAGFTIVSGLAQGIDTIAHQTCLEFGGRTIGVMGTGVNRIYPSSNRDLARRILASGLVLSEYPADTPPNRTHFPSRNRIIAGLCRATLVLEAGEKSGALITARVANDYGRDVYALPGSLDYPESAGCLNLINRGAQIILSENHLLDLLGQLPQMDEPAAQLSLLPPELPPDLQHVFQAVPREASSLDWLVETTGMATSNVLSALVQLEIMGLVTQIPGMRYQRAC
nr:MULTISPECIES: DNA-processing protein DprA [unclassified Leptolyngbya]